MRITREGIIRSALAGLAGNLSRFHRAESEVVTGRKVQKSSDEPLAAGSVLNINARLEVAGRYRRAATMATTRMAAEEAILASVEEVSRQAHDMGSSAAASPTPEMRQRALENIRSLKQQLIAVGNTRVGGEYIMSGLRSDVPPFAADGSYQGNDNRRETEIGEGIRIPVNHPGSASLEPALKAFDRLTTALETGSSSDIEAAIQGLDSARALVRGAQGELGAWQRQAGEMDRRLARDTETLIGERSNLIDSDPTEGLLKLNQSKNALDLTYASVSRVLSSSLLQYLR